MILLMCDIDLGQLLLDCYRGRLHTWSFKICAGYACNVVVSAAGYPNEYRKGYVIRLEEPPKGVAPSHVTSVVSRGRQFDGSEKSSICWCAMRSLQGHAFPT